VYIHHSVIATSEEKKEKNKKITHN